MAGRHDVIIIGGGPAGISAALWCEDLGLSAVLVEQEPELGGQLHRIYAPVVNYPGLTARDGTEMASCFLKSLEGRSVRVLTGAELIEVALSKRSITLGEGSKLTANALILATGVRRRRLGVSGEEEFRDRGVLESGARDAGSVAGKRVAVVGGGDAALENALILSRHAERILLIHRRDNFSARTEFLDEARSTRNIEFVTNARVTAACGRDRLDGLTVEQDGSEHPLPVDYLLVRIGVRPNTEFIKDQLLCDADGYIRVDSSAETSVPGVFAVGDAAHRLSPTIATAVGTGATAAKVIRSRLG